MKKKVVEQYYSHRKVHFTSQRGKVGIIELLSIN